MDHFKRLQYSSMIISLSSVKYNDLVQGDKIYLCSVYVAQHYHHTLCDKDQQEDGGKLKPQQKHIVRTCISVVNEEQIDYITLMNFSWTFQ